MEDWDLQAVVRGCTSEASANIMNNPSPSLFAPLVLDQGDDLFSDFPGIFQSSIGDFDEFEGLYKPFCPELHQVPLSPQSFLSIASTTSMSVPSEANNKDSPKFQKIPEKQPISEVSSGASWNDVSHAAKWKRSRKNHQKRVVQQVTADGLSSDMWAWRKYGQKPIKGSPYPRSYYRCSSLKGCLARKQVERSCSDPSIFIVTYTAEHSHAHPSRKNALAGSTRVKPSTASKKATTNESKLPTSSKDECSPTTPSLASINTNDDDFVHQLVTTRNAEEEQILEANGTMSSQMFLPESIFSDDELYPSLEDFQGLLFDQFVDTVPEMV